LLFNTQCGCSIAFQIIPNRVPGLTSLEVFTKTKSNHQELLCAHVWGCPVFVLDPRLQDGKKIPKWNCRARLAQFVGFLPEHSTLVANVQHLQTNHVSPKFHLIHNDNFETILNDTLLDHSLSDKRLLDIFDTSCEVYSEIERAAQKMAQLFTRCLLLMISGWMKVNAVRGSALKLQKNVLRHVTVSISKLKNLRCLYLLASPLTFFVIVLLVLLFLTTTIPCLLPMRTRLPLVTTIPSSPLTLVVVVSAPGRMRELLLVVRAKAKG
jgi:hypothetical protein